MPEEEPSVMSWEELSLTERRIKSDFFSFPTISNNLTPDNTLPGNKYIVGNRDLERCPREK